MGGSLRRGGRGPRGDPSSPCTEEASTMTLLRGTAGAALSLLLLAPSAPAAWNNVFQVTCHGCRRPATSAYVAVPAPTTCCAPPQVAYVQRSYYQPVTTFEPVT